MPAAVIQQIGIQKGAALLDDEHLGAQHQEIMDLGRLELG
jgi:hypothetical protein